jgi:hypothetical protein
MLPLYLRFVTSTIVRKKMRFSCDRSLDPFVVVRVQKISSPLAPLYRLTLSNIWSGEKYGRDQLVDIHGSIPRSIKFNDSFRANLPSTKHLIKRSLKLGHVSTSTRPSATALPGILVSRAK